MTFETAISFLRQAALGGKRDTLTSPSARIVVGQPCFGGTGSFRVVQDLVKAVAASEAQGGNVMKNKKKRWL